MENTQIPNKWKIFSLNHHLSDYEGDGVALFDSIALEDDIRAVFKRHRVNPWYPFEYMDSDNPEEFAEFILSMAIRAFEIEKEGD